MNKYTPTEWARPDEIWANEVSLWGLNGIMPDDAVQGILEDCWFMSAAAALAENPERIRKIFTNTKTSQEGIYQVTFWKRMKPVKVVVDDQIPLYPGRKVPMFAKPSENGAWWMVILEKAYAKFNVNYANLDIGIAMQSFRDLSGMPVIWYPIASQND